MNFQDFFFADNFIGLKSILFSFQLDDRSDTVMAEFEKDTWRLISGRFERYLCSGSFQSLYYKYPFYTCHIKQFRQEPANIIISMLKLKHPLENKSQFTL